MKTIFHFLNRSTDRFIISLSVLTVFLCSCDYLDVVPDNVPTIDHAFRTRTEAQKYLYGCLSYIPGAGDVAQNPAFYGGDEVWTLELVYNFPSNGTQFRHIAMGDQGTIAPYGDCWASIASDRDLRGGTPMWTGLRDCDIFLDNIHKPYDLMDEDRDRWIAEVKFVKAYIYFYLFRMYGPIPVFRESLPIDAVGDEVQQFREPVDTVVNHICALIDEAVPLLPEAIYDQAAEMGRPTKAIALALKAQALTYLASPLFNCNTDYASFTDNRGVQLFPQDESAEKAKWERAAAALKVAIDAAHAAGHALFDFHTNQYAASLSEQTILAMQVRGAVTERWNPEIIWGSSSLANHVLLQKACTPIFQATNYSGGSGLRSHAPTLRMVEQFYTKNGIPIEDDAEWTGVDPMGLRIADADDRQYIKQGYQTINLHFDREARFYSSLIFDGGTYYGNQRTSDNANDPNYLWVTEMKTGQLNAGISGDRYSPTGYICKKLVSYKSTVPLNSDGYTAYNYAFPIIRLADLYLMYTEALNEAKDAPDAEVYEYIDKIRERSGLEGVVKSWNDHAVAGKKSKPSTTEGMRDIIRRERLNELAFEGSRFWDLRRWKLAEEYMNRPVRGLTLTGREAEEFYQPRVLYSLKFDKKDYFWPVRTDVLVKNPNLLQSPEW
jgi:hypothetical protein